MSDKTRTDLTDVFASSKNIVPDEGETFNEAAVFRGDGKLILAPSLRISDNSDDDESQRKERFEEKISSLEETRKDIVDPWEPDAAFGDLSFDISEAVGKDASIENQNEIYDRGEQGIEKPAVSLLSVDYEELKPIVSDIIHKELRGVLGEKITSNIRGMVRREIKIAINNITRDRTN